MLRAARTASLVLLLSALAVISIATAVAMRSPPSATAVITPSPSANVDSGDTASLLASRRLLIPVEGITRKQLRDNFAETRGTKRRHDALDIMAPRGTPIYAVDDGRVAKLFKSAAGGLTIYQFDPSGDFAYYYAHLDSNGAVSGGWYRQPLRFPGFYFSWVSPPIAFFIEATRLGAARRARSPAPAGANGGSPRCAPRRARNSSRARAAAASR